MTDYINEEVIIKFPEDWDLQFKLEKKLAEYEARWEAYKEKNPFKAPEVQKNSDDFYKVRVLKELIQYKEINTSKFAEHIKKTENFISESYFNNACAVIRDYCETGGLTVRNGTGL
ncbi:hypothetical protein ACFL1H_06845 [Nanoarchaeota archaeon]